MKSPLRIICACAFIGLASLAAIGPAAGDWGVNHYILGCANFCSSAIDFSIGSPGAITTDVPGNVFFSSPNFVLKLDTHGNLTRVAGNADAGYSGDGGPATEALLNFPQVYPELLHDPVDFGELIAGLAVDASGNLYIADALNNRVRRVDTRGVITTVVNPAVAPAQWPQGVATDGAGDLYISYAYGYLVKLSPDGAFSGLAGNNCGPGFTGPGLCGPEGIAVDSTGNVYVPDNLCRVRKIRTDGSIVTIAGEDAVPDNNHGLAFTCGFSGDGGPATQATLSNQPFGVAVDRTGNVYIADTYNNRIRKIDATGTITTIAGTGSPGYSGDGGPAAKAQLNSPHGVAVDATGNIYIADSANLRIRKISSDGIIRTVAGGGNAVPVRDQGVALFAINPGITGSWYDPAQSGQGLSLEVLPDNRILAFWFTFNPDGKQQTWLVGTGTYNGNVATIDPVAMPTGGRWIPNFNPTLVVDEAWGRMTLTFADADHGKVDFNSALGYGSGSMNLTRLTRPAGITTTALSGSGKAWVATGNLNTPRVSHTATRLANGSVLVAGGWQLTGTTYTPLASAELYDPAAGTWTLTGNMSRPRGGHTATLLSDGRVLVAGGDVNESSLSLGLQGTTELYDPVTGRWTATGSFNTPRVGFTATLLDGGRVLVAGGVDNGDDSLTSAELYDPAAGTWSYTGSLRHPRLVHTASLLGDGRVLVAGGWDDDFLQTTTATAELYDPIAGTWSAAAPMIGNRVLHTATVLANGNVLVAGGYDEWPYGVPFGHSVPTSFSDAQVFDVSTGSWARVGSLNVARGGHTATRLPDDTVLVTGGADAAGQGSVPDVANAEIFDPTSATWSSGGGFYSGLAHDTATLLQNGNVLLSGGGGSANATVSAEIYANGSVSAGAGTTGAWYDPAQSGHGLVLEALQGDQLLATWFAFDPTGTQQSWFLGLGIVSDNTASIASVVQPTGGRFIPNFDPSKIVNNPWGTLTFTFTDCDHGKVDFASTAGYGTGSMNLTRLTRPAGVVCP